MTEEKITYDIEKIKQEQAALSRYAAIKHASEDTIGVNRVYLEMVDYDHEAALVLDELMFWTLPQARTHKTGLRVQRDGYLWLAVARTEWKERKGLLERQADRAINKLIEMGLIVKDNFYFNGKPRIHLRVSPASFFAAYTRVMALRYTDQEIDETADKTLEDLYEMMNWSNLPNGNLPNGNSNLPNGEFDNLPNGEFINSPDIPNSPLQPGYEISKERKTEKLGDIIDGMKDLYNMPGAKLYVLKAHIESRVKVRLNLNPSARDGRSFVEHAARAKKSDNQDIDKFLDWWLSNNPDPKYWSFSRMIERWNMAFAVSIPGAQYREPARAL